MAARCGLRWVVRVSRCDYGSLVCRGCASSDSNQGCTDFGGVGVEELLYFMRSQSSEISNDFF